jgi:hypothetical protein
MRIIITPVRSQVLSPFLWSSVKFSPTLLVTFYEDDILFFKSMDSQYFLGEATGPKKLVIGNIKRKNSHGY